MAWTASSIPSQAGKTAIVTGAGGLGHETALELARAGAEVVLAGRNADKGRESVAKIVARVPAAKIRFEHLDLASLASVADFAARVSGVLPSLDVLVNNAGVMTPPRRRTTADGFELQFGTNYLGHFALTANLLPLLRRAAHPRVVNVSSSANRTGTIQFDDLQFEKRYPPWAAYSQSKLANLLFTLELQRRSDAHGWGLMSNAAHPGYALTELIPNGPGTKGVFAALSRFLALFLSHSATAGALPTLFAATSPDAKPAGYYGPDGPFELKGPPAPARIVKKARDQAVARRLWEISQELAGVRFDG